MTLYDAVLLNDLKSIKKLMAEGDHLKIDSAWATRRDRWNTPFYDGWDLVGTRAALLALKRNNAEALTYLLQHGVDVNVRSGAGDALLLEACRDYSFEMIRLLVELSADVNVKHKFGGWTPVSVAEIQRTHVAKTKNKFDDSVSVAYYLRAHGATD